LLSIGDGQVEVSVTIGSAAVTYAIDALSDRAGGSALRASELIQADQIIEPA